MKSEELKRLAESYGDYMTQMRRRFHRHPELSGQEYETRKVLIEEIEKMGIPYRLLDGTGIIAVIKGGKPGKNRVIRADIDGLPVKEETCNLKKEKECISETEGLCHACGHDAHMAMLLGTMKVLTQIQDQVPGTVYCCFEEGEEENCGIATMLKALEDYPVDECFALHVYSGLASGKINVTPGPKMAGTVGIGFYVNGKAGHGSRPDQAANPIIPAAHIVTQLDSAFRNQIDAEETVTLGLCVFQAGEATNVIPERAYIAGTARYFNKAEGEKALEIVKNVAVHTAVCHKCTIEFAERNKISLLPVVNDEKVAARVEKAVSEMCGADVLPEKNDRWYASECYSMYLEKYPGALGLLGIRNEAYGSGAAHHNGKFDVDESVFPLGVCAELGYVFSE